MKTGPPESPWAIRNSRSVAGVVEVGDEDAAGEFGLVVPEAELEVDGAVNDVGPGAAEEVDLVEGLTAVDAISGSAEADEGAGAVLLALAAIERCRGDSRDGLGKFD